MEKNINIEIQEVKVILKEILSQIDDALKHFKFAERLGIFDIFFGGFFVSLWKRNKIKKANEICVEMQANMNNLTRELKDVDIDDDFTFEDGFIFETIDVWFDNILVDMYVQDKISNVVNRLEVFKHRLENLDRELEKIK